MSTFEFSVRRSGLLQKSWQRLMKDFLAKATTPRSKRSLVSAFCGFTTMLVAMVAHAQVGKPPAIRFRHQVIDADVKIGYGTAIGDVDGDGRPDILLADKKQFVWYQNPTWQKHVMADNLTQADNVCIAARDIDGDGRVEVAVGGQWQPSDTVNSGAVFSLIAPPDRTQRWLPVQLHHEPVVHRMRWLRLNRDRFVLVVAPLHGRGNRNGEGDGVRLLAYHPPEKGGNEWRHELIDDTLHVTHNFDPIQWDTTTPGEELLYAGREGAMLISHRDGKWQKHRLDRVRGSGEIRLAKTRGGQRMVVTIEPLHGTELVCYPAQADAPAADATIIARHVLDDKLNAGHAVAAADLFGTGGQQVVAGWRSPNAEGKVGVKLYYADSADLSQWKSVWLDDNSMATEDLRIGDLNGDGRPDIVAAGRSTKNLKIYWNEIGP